MSSEERKKLDELLARIEAQTRELDPQSSAGAAEPPQPRTPDPKKPGLPKKPRGLLDLIAVSMAVYTMVVTTPVGGLVVRGYYWATSSRTKTKPLISYFSGGGAGSSSRLKKLVEPSKRNAMASRVARRLGLSPSVAQAVAFMTSDGNEDARGHFEVELLPAGRASLSSVGVAFPAKEAPAKKRARRLIKGVAKLKKRLGGIEPAVVALAVEMTHVEYALERARAAGALDPVKFAELRPYLPPEQRDEADNLVKGTFALATAYDMHWPVPEGSRVSSKFGYRMHPVLGRRKLHKGTDFAIPTGTFIYAISDGKVLYAARDNINGNFIKLDHGHGLTSAYCHNSQLNVSRGDTVKKGDMIALSGATGRATGPHLHFQLELDHQPIDAEIFKKDGASLMEGIETETATSAATP